MRIRDNILLLNLYTFFSGLIFIVPVIIPYYKDHIGLSFQHFMIGEIAFSIVVIALEVPSGLLSDIWNRKHVLALAMIAEIAGFFLLLIANSLFMAVMAQAIIGISISLFSGTNSALLYDTLLAQGREKEFQKREGKRLGLSLYGIGIASLAGGFLYEYSASLPILLTMAGLFIAFICALLMTEPERHKSAIEHHPIADMLSTMHYALRGHIEVGLIILAAAILFSSTKLIMWAQQPYYMALDLPEAMFGVLMACGYLLGGMASHSSHLFAKTNNIQAFKYAWFIVVLICIGAAMLFGSIGVALLMFGGSCIYGAVNPRINAAINSRVGSRRRATIISTANLLRSLLFIPLALGLGFIVDYVSIQAGLYSIALWLMFSGTALFFIAKSYHSRIFE